MGKNRYFDNTRLSAFKDCPRKYYLRHVKHLRPEGTAMPLVFGICWHDAMDTVWGLAHSDKTDREIAKLALHAFHKRWVEEGLEPFDRMPMHTAERLMPRTPGVAAEMLINYVAQRRPYIQQCEILAIERPFAVKMIQDDGTFYIGRIDKLAKTPEGLYFFEHKTTTAYKKDGGFRLDWLNSWSPNSQIDGYLHVGKIICGEQFRGGMIDGALVHKHVHDKFKFIPIERRSHFIEDWLNEAQAWINYVEDAAAIYAETNDLNRAYPKNTESCYGKFGPCAFVDICRYVNKPDEQDDYEGYVREKWEPFNILNLAEIGMEPEE